MPHIVPSVVVGVINGLFPFLGDDRADPALDWTSAKQLAGALAILDQIPGELLTVPPEDLARLLVARATVAAFIEESRSLGKNARSIRGQPVRAIRDIIARCPDHVIPAAVTSLAFVVDAGFRDGLRRDIASVESSLKEGDWKPATVMAGSVVEALLLWALQQQPAGQLAAAAVNLVAARTLERAPPGNLEEWGLHQFIEVAAALNVIRGDTAAQLRLAKNFRNLIHPGRATRLAMVCDRGTALASIAALEFVIRDLTPP